MWGYPSWLKSGSASVGGRVSPGFIAASRACRMGSSSLPSPRMALSRRWRCRRGGGGVDGLPPRGAIAFLSLGDHDALDLGRDGFRWHAGLGQPPAEVAGPRGQHCGPGGPGGPSTYAADSALGGPGGFFKKARIFGPWSGWSGWDGYFNPCYTQHLLQDPPSSSSYFFYR